MGFREFLSLPPGCSLRKDFPDGEVYIQMSGVESYEGPAHVNLYGRPWEEVPRTPVMHVTVPMGTSADHHLEEALRREHDDVLDCIALSSLGAVARSHREEATL